MKFNVPDRKHCGGEKRMVSFRMPIKLKAELERIAERRGWAFVDIVMTALDQYVQWEDARPSSPRQRGGKE